MALAELNNAAQPTLSRQVTPVGRLWDRSTAWQVSQSSAELASLLFAGAILSRSPMHAKVGGVIGGRRTDRTEPPQVLRIEFSNPYVYGDLCMMEFENAFRSISSHRDMTYTATAETCQSNNCLKSAWRHDFGR